jgi:DNA-binding HxlR family transcriptional regulator
VRRRRRSDCPVHFALDVFGDPWTLLIVRDLMFKRRATYSDFLRAEEGIATNILANRLAKLESDGIAVRDPGTGRYRLTPSGVALMPILLEMMLWGAEHDPRTAASPAFIERIRTDREALAAELRGALEAPDSTLTPGSPPA